MNMGNRWIAAIVLVIAAVFTVPQTASAQQAQDEDVREYVDAAEVVMRGGQPYYRYSDAGHPERLRIERDPAGQALYYRVIGRDRGYYRPGYDRYTRCDSRGICRVEYYDPRYDRRGNYRVYDDYARRYVRGEL
ncbi:MAG: hypothetical protein Q4B94_00750 [Pseudomonadota bacterium]|nr:hypothetical protein [Pseudomonadota bacterium]